MDSTKLQRLSETETVGNVRLGLRIWLIISGLNH